MQLQKLLSTIIAKESRRPLRDRSGFTVEPLIADRSSADPQISSLAYDSRKVEAGGLFFAVPGEHFDGHVFLDDALSRGAVAVASERTGDPRLPAAWVQVSAIRPFMAMAANHFFGEPSRRLGLAAITGTNGKTTTAYLIHSVLSRTGPSLLIGTVQTVLGTKQWESERTTPEAVDLQNLLVQAIEAGCRAGVMEVSSHALSMYRVYRSHFPVAVFTNLTQDHLDFHQTMENYFRAKSLLFYREYNPGLRFAIVNGDDPFSRQLPRVEGVEFFRYGFGSECEVRPLFHHTSVKGTRLQLTFQGRRLELESALAGEHNAYNLMAAAAACSCLGFSDDQIRTGLAAMKSVPGRFEKVEVALPFTVVLDYAHTPHALENVLRLCRKLRRRQTICVVGCGGDRDRAKRPLMGAIATRDADRVILTSDNPRSESPEKIIEDIRMGIPAERTNYEVVVDRREAIERALRLAEEGDIVLLAGKGHETYQEVEGRKNTFDERQIVKELA